MGKENIEDIEDSDYYECILTPKNAPTESKNGITLNGSNDQYVDAHLELMKLFKVKGDHFIINKTEINICRNIEITDLLSVEIVNSGSAEKSHDQS